MKLSLRRSVLILAGLGLVCAVVLIGWRFNRDVALATARAAQGGVLLATRCGPIEYQEAGTGVPLLVVHGSGGGHDQGMAFAGTLARHGVRVIAMSRFGYGTYASAQYTAGRIAGAKFVGFDHGGHVWVGHDEEVMAEILRLLDLPARP